MLLIVVVVLLSISSAVAFSSARVTKLQKLANPAPPPKVVRFKALSLLFRLFTSLKGYKNRHPMIMNMSSLNFTSSLPCVPQEAFRPKMMPEGVKFSQDSELEQAKRSTKKIYQEIPTNKVL